MSSSAKKSAGKKKGNLKKKNLIEHEFQRRPRVRLRQLLRRKETANFWDSSDCFACKKPLNAARFKSQKIEKITSTPTRGPKASTVAAARRFNSPALSFLVALIPRTLTSWSVGSPAAKRVGAATQARAGKLLWNLVGCIVLYY